jgi:hypothetical protein
MPFRAIPANDQFLGGWGRVDADSNFTGGESSDTTSSVFVQPLDACPAPRHSEDRGWRPCTRLSRADSVWARPVMRGHAFIEHQRKSFQADSHRLGRAAGFGKEGT